MQEFNKVGDKDFDKGPGSRPIDEGSWGSRQFYFCRRKIKLVCRNSVGTQSTAADIFDL
jgi:hypothetical protein